MKAMLLRLPCALAGIWGLIAAFVALTSNQSGSVSAARAPLAMSAGAGSAQAAVNASGRLVSVAAIDASNINALTGIYIAGMLLFLGQLSQIVLSFIEKYRKIDETSEHGRRIATEAKLADTVREYEGRLVEQKKTYEDRIAQIIASGALNIQGLETQVKMLRDQVSFMGSVNETLQHQLNIKEDRLREKDAAVRQSVQNTGEVIKRIQPAHDHDPDNGVTVVENKVEIHTDGAPCPPGADAPSSGPVVRTEGG